MTISISLEQPETFDAGGATFRVLDDGGSTSGRIGVVECRLVPRWAGPPQHVHREHDETLGTAASVGESANLPRPSVCGCSPTTLSRPRHRTSNVETSTTSSRPATFVLTGAVRFTSGTDSLIASSGQLVTVPIGDPHSFANADDQAPASLLCTLTPQRYIDYFRELTRLTPGTDGRLDPAEILAVMARYATEPYRPQP